MLNYNKLLDDLAAADNLRTLKTAQGGGREITIDGQTYINMSSNDYLGLTADVELQREFFEELAADGKFVMSNASSRLVTGNGEDYDALEAALEHLYPRKRALVLGSGYLANAGLLPALTQKGDLILADKLVHASLIDGMRLCDCEWTRFRHNDMEHLEKLLRGRGAAQRTWVVTESIFSMDGDRAPLRELAELKRRYDFSLYLDEAHAVGVCGCVWGGTSQAGVGLATQAGAGLAAHEGITDAVDVLVGTFGKALASYGAFAAVEPTVREVLVNRARTLIFSTALPPATLAWSRKIIEMLPSLESRREHLRALTLMLGGKSHIIPIMAGANANALKMAAQMREAGFWAAAIRYPTVPQGAARVRVSLSAALTVGDVQKFVELCRSIG